MNDWIDVRKKLPKHMQEILVLYNNNRVTVTIYLDNKKMLSTIIKAGLTPDNSNPIAAGVFAHQDRNGLELNGVTHWMPLPEPSHEND